MTLVEMLVVLAIVAISASLIALSIGSDTGVAERTAARKIQSQIQLAADYSMFANVPVAMRMEAHGYQFVEKPDPRGPWVAVSQPLLEEPFQVPDGMNLSVDSALISLDVHNGAPPFRIVLEDESRWQIEFDGITARLAPAPVADE